MLATRFEWVHGMSPVTIDFRLRISSTCNKHINCRQSFLSAALTIDPLETRGKHRLCTMDPTQHTPGRFYTTSMGHGLLQCVMNISMFDLSTSKVPVVMVLGIGAIPALLSLLENRLVPCTISNKNCAPYHVNNSRFCPTR